MPGWSHATLFKPAYRARAGLPVGALLVAGAIVGCGGSGSQSPTGTNARRFPPGAKRQVAQVIDTLQSLSRSGQAQAICQRLFTSSEASAIAAHGHTTCPAQVKRQLVSSSTSFTVQALRVHGSQAVAVVVEQNGHHTGLYLVRQNGAWRIQSVYKLK